MGRGPPRNKKMRKRNTIYSAVALFTLLANSEVSVEAQNTEEKKPNILLIFLDDLGYADVGFNAKLFGVETDVVTPNIDALANRSTIFKQAYVAHPFCGPSRMALLSGRMPHCYGGQKNLPDFAKHLEDYNEKGIPENETLMSTVLKLSLIHI